jgi:hypothetical protein
MITQTNITKQDFQIYLRNTQKLVRTFLFNLFSRYACNFSQKDQVIWLWITTQYFEVLNKAEG